MEELPAPSTCLSKPCFQVVGQKELAAFPLNKKYHQVQSLGDAQGPQVRSSPREPPEHVYLVPNQFPFIFKITRAQLQTELDLAVLDKTFRTLNTMRRIQVVRSVIPKKTVYSNLQGLKGDPIGRACLKVSIMDPLTGVELRRASHQLNLVQAKNHICSHVDFEQSDARRCSGPSEAIEVETRCSVMSVELSASSSAYSKSSKFLLFFEELRKIKPRSDLFYCLAKLRSGVILKIYFTPFVVSPAQSSPSDAKKTALRLFGLKVCKTWVCIDKDLLPTFSQPSSGPAPREETKWTVSRQLQPAHNYRFNVSSGTSEINNKHLKDELVSETAAGGGWQHSREPDHPQLCTRKNPEFWPVVELDRTSKAKAPHSNTKTQNLHQTSSAKMIQRSMATAYDSSNLLAANIESFENSLGFAGL